MSPLLIALLAIVVVVGGILWLRLHAFLALLLGGLVVAVFSSPESLFEQEIGSSGFHVATVDAGQGTVTVQSGGKETAIQELGPGYYEIYRHQQDSGSLASQGSVLIQGNDLAAAHMSELESGDLLVPASVVSSAKDEINKASIERLASGFGDTCRKIGLLIAMASIIGACLLESGAAVRIVNAARSACGDRNTPLAFTASGFVIGIPVYFDTVFYLMIPLAKALRLRTGKNYILYVMSIIVGATMAHSLIPPTPGPLLVAGELGIDLLTMIVGGTIVGLIAVTAGYAYTLWANSLWDIPLRETATEVEETANNAEQSEKTISETEIKLPPLWLSIAPILLPVLLLTAATTTDKVIPILFDNEAQTVSQLEYFEHVVRNGIAFAGNKNIALLAGTLIGLVMLYRALAGAPERLKTVLGQALGSAGMILLITAAGGAFGHVLRQSGIAGAIQDQFPDSTTGIGLLFLAFGLTVIVRFAQGSATVAMITAVGIVAPLASLNLPFHPVYLALAIGCGSKPFPWMNDSGFWVVSKMTGMTEGETLKTFSAVLSVMGFVGFGAVVIGALVFPLAA